MPVFPIERDSASAEFLDGTKRGEFLLVRDTETGEILSPQFDVSVQPDRYTRVPAAGTGTVVSWSVVHQRGLDGAVHRLPVGIVELDEGPWWWTSFPGADPAADLFGARVKVAFEVLGEAEAAEAIPFFELV
ncbi:MULTISPECIES: Zn-ribbon domain-containing OB-fold protein [Mycolicibacterium]|jgi:uncharacterized OB-fold protein|uniref:ChsH2 C-terminal OB-fold domain-containing protein n=2 Tax=Mycolicibacterium TaxID=1866885 RepID=A1TD37_MYCVP|nr:MULTISPECIES: OB-fold domain-containing protein [Mycolicibacterium]ABM15087.1 conserved hypothetical protein [Mycolicibacterium vanbaalenii PYR-1]MCV7129830.1 OB-fold domain-containing protein [Mycolicibacterium vanbaalenii PYR-1]MDN4518328.1 OB-fold domain-containing protein [Mycolicibacterium austroafricanum]MDW5612337.1 OB-fold domain-containing protein [Mycolicibacterium sp. D5.8-2]PQP47549.1 hypothetical protein C6A88_15730 [Mycolicibacterium austroafricanum]